jgi:hypothetical protein
MYLKADAAGDRTSLLSFFRITRSPHGVGHALVLVQDPSGANPAGNKVLTDNEPMARFLVDGFMSHFAALRGRLLLKTLAYRPLDSVRRGGDPRTTYSEFVTAPGMEVELRWGGLGTPYAVDHHPEQGATGQHQMYSLFVDSDAPAAFVNGRRLPGSVQPRPVYGRECRSAFLAFSETWSRK